MGRQETVNWCLLLRLRGAEVHTAGDGVSGLEAVRRCRPDAVVLDLGMPRMNGYDTAREIRKLPGGEKILLLALSGWGQTEDRERSVNAGFDLHLVKPGDVAAISNAIARGRNS